MPLAIFVLVNQSIKRKQITEIFGNLENKTKQTNRDFWESRKTVVPAQAIEGSLHYNVKTGNWEASYDGHMCLCCLLGWLVWLVGLVLVDCLVGLVAWFGWFGWFGWLAWFCLIVWLYGMMTMPDVGVTRMTLPLARARIW